MAKTKGAVALRKLRKVHDLSLRHIGERLGVSKQTVFKYEHGIARPSADACDVLDDIFGLAPGTFRELFDRRG